VKCVVRPSPLTLLVIIASSRDGATQSSSTLREQVEKITSRRTRRRSSASSSTSSRFPTSGGPRNSQNATTLQQMLAKRGSRRGAGDGRIRSSTASGACRRDPAAAVLRHTTTASRESAGLEAADAVHPILRRRPPGRRREGDSRVATLTAFKRLASLRAVGSDDKSPIVALLTALDALAAAEARPDVEPAHRPRRRGRSRLAEPRPGHRALRQLLDADAMLILDGPLHPSEKPTLVFRRARHRHAELTVFGPKVALHSGHYGNWVRNPRCGWRSCWRRARTMRDRWTIAALRRADAADRGGAGPCSTPCRTSPRG